jgi:uncharacterized protein (PEP-CTERM system associated)
MMCSLLSLRALRITATSVPVAASLVMASAGAYAQESGSDSGLRRAVSIVPRVSVTETLTDNVRLSSVDKQADLITEISPGIRISSEGRRLKGYFDYSLSKIAYAQSSSSSQFQQALNTFGTLEAVDNWAYLDFSGSISQQAISAFGTQSIDNTSVNSNRAEVSSYRISPYVRGRLGDLASYEARYSRAGTNSDSAVASDVKTTDGVLKISGDSAFRNLGWSADASQQTIDYSAGRPTEADLLNLGLSYVITPQLRVSGRAGREANNYTSVDKKSYGTSGFGVNWSPSAMTTLSASRDHRSFGDAHSLSFEHRTARTAWKFTDSKDILVTPSQTGIASLGSIYDLLYRQFASIEPNPAARAQLVNAFLQANGVSPNATAISNFLTSAVSLEHRQDLSFALLGVRDTITFIATRSESSRLDTLSTAVDDLTKSSLVRQRGFSVNYAHRLTPDYSLGVLASQQNISGVSSLQDATLRLLNFNVTGKVGKQATVSVGVRHVVYNSSTAPYVENAVIGTLIVQF